MLLREGHVCIEVIFVVQIQRCAEYLSDEYTDFNSISFTGLSSLSANVIAATLSNAADLPGTTTGEVKHE